MRSPPAVHAGTQHSQGKDAMAKVRAAKVLVVGAGGIGEQC